MDNSFESHTDDLRFFAPIDISKGKNKEGVEVMKIAGIASTSRQDSDGEFLNPKGFDIDYFMKKGFLNWNHETSKNPLSYIGRPTKGEITNRGFEIEGELFANNPKAKQVYQLGEILKSNGMDLGFSIEGKVIERDERNPKIVKKAKITGCAITPNPKNQDAIASFIKGESNDFGVDHFEELDFSLLETIEKAISPSDEEDDDSIEKSTDTASVEPLRKESLGKKTKNLVKYTKGKKVLTKAGIYAKLYSDFPKMEDITVTKLFDLINTIEKSHKMKDNQEGVEISAEAIEKAYQTLGLSKGEEGEAMEESSTESNEEGETASTENKVGASIEEMTAEQREAHKEELTKSLAAINELEAAELTSTEEERIEAAKTILEAANFTITKGEENELNEGGSTEGRTEEGDDGVVDIVKGMLTEFKESRAKADKASATLVKGLQDTINKQAEEVGDLKEMINTIGENSQGRKAVIASHEIQKGFDGSEMSQNASQVLSISNNKKEVLDLLEKGYMSADGLQVTNNTLANKTMIFESSNEVSPEIINFAKSAGYTLVK